MGAKLVSQFEGDILAENVQEFDAEENHHHHISVMELGHLLTRFGITYPEVSSKVCHDSFCQLGNSVSPASSLRLASG